MRFRAWVATAGLVALLGCAEELDDADPTASSEGSEGSAGSESDSGDSAAELGCAAGAEGDTTDGAMEPLLDTWGAPCNTDAECVELIGDPEAICETAAVIYELPAGYCSKPCQLPDMATRVVPDDPTCDPDGGVACIGLMGMFQRCAKLCTDDAQCNRDGYICRQMPLISEASDPKACLMPDCCQDTCAE